MTATVTETVRAGRSYWSPECAECNWYPKHAYYGDPASERSAQLDADEHDVLVHEMANPRPEWSRVMRWCDDQLGAKRIEDLA